jgi:hypothetical protein
VIGKAKPFRTEGGKAALREQGKAALREQGKAASERCDVRLMVNHRQRETFAVL